LNLLPNKHVVKEFGDQIVGTKIRSKRDLGIRVNLQALTERTRDGVK
jgi:hypothetical protein